MKLSSHDVDDLVYAIVVVLRQSLQHRQAIVDHAEVRRATNLECIYTRLKIDHVDASDNGLADQTNDQYLIFFEPLKCRSGSSISARALSSLIALIIANINGV